MKHPAVVRMTASCSSRRISAPVVGSLPLTVSTAVSCAAAVVPEEVRPVAVAVLVIVPLVAAAVRAV